jgi:hypothetical protein
LLILGHLRSSNCESFGIAQILIFEVVWVYFKLHKVSIIYSFISLASTLIGASLFSVMVLGGNKNVMVITAR